jgi:hypothetical protein
MKNHIHQPTDDMNLPIDFKVCAKFGELFRRVTLNAANAAQPPLWYEGDIFADRFAPKAKRAKR